MTLHEDVATTILAIQATGATEDHQIVDELIARGYDPLRAEVLAVFVPLGLARALIKRLPAKPPIRLSKTAVVHDFTSKRHLTLKLASVPEFEMACHIGEETFVHGVIPRELFSSAVAFSVELKLINQALDAGSSLGGGTMAPPRLLRLADTPGFDEWFATVSRAN